MNGNNMFNNWNNMNNPNNMNMNGFINTNMGMNYMNDPMQIQMNMTQYSVNNNAKQTDRLPTNNENAPTDPFPGYQGERTNLIFQTSKGFKITIIAPLDITINQALVEYIKRVGLGPNALYDGFFFLYNGAKVDIYDKVKLVKDLATMGNLNQNHIVIVVVDTKNLIGS